MHQAISIWLCSATDKVKANTTVHGTKNMYLTNRLTMLTIFLLMIISDHHISIMMISFRISSIIVLLLQILTFEFIFPKKSLLNTTVLV